jgi:phosphonate transport system permease protein
MLPPDFSDAPRWVKPLLDTFAMSVAGTALAIALALPLAFLAARNITPGITAWQMARAVLNGLRAVPELIFGIVLVAAVGFGALPGVLALGIHSAGMVGKFFAEAFELADRAPIEAARAAGASSMQVVTHGILPQVLPRLADTAIYRWEYNFRASMVLGMVGAGGIGTELVGSLRIMQYRTVSSLMLVILILVTGVDALSSWLRRKFA